RTVIRRYVLAVAISTLTAVHLTQGFSLSAGQSKAPSTALVPLPGPSETRTPLGDGRWLRVGGQGQDGPLSTVSLFDPFVQTTFVLPSLHEARAWHTATLLADGSVLVAGGIGSAGHAIASAERFDPATETW